MAMRWLAWRPQWMSSRRRSTRSLPRFVPLASSSLNNNMTALPFPVWFVRRVPVESIRGGKPVPSLVAKEIWFPPLLSDIEERGLQNPLLIVSHHPRTDREHQWIRVGMNRLCAVKALGWSHAPCIVTGCIDKWEIPKGKPIVLQGVLLETVEEVNSYFVGGRFKLYQNNEVGFQNDLIPEKGKF